MLLSDETVSASFVVSDSGELRSRDGRLWIGLRQKPGADWLRRCFPLIAAGSEAVALFVAAIVTGYLYHRLAFAADPAFETLYQLGGLISLLVVLGNASRHEYQIARFLTSKGYMERAFQLWNFIFLASAAFWFLTKTSTNFSRMTILLYYVIGFASIVVVRSTLAHWVQTGSKRGTVSVRRTFLVGTHEELKAFGERYQPWNLGIEIVGVATLSTGATLASDESEKQIADDLERATATARTLDLDDVFVLAPWSDHHLISRCVDSFLKLPAAIHLGPERIFDRFEDMRLAKIGPISSLNLVRRPLSISEQIMKRLLDLSLASVALIAFAPVFVVLAIAIKMESRGPVLFKQRRFGFNQKPFNIYKFRSMRTLDDGAVVHQARKNDSRVTRVGYWLRRLSLDELPQLWNVMLGQMSLVGPRPHALAHDREFERKISLYARRHNVKPGITGWAQVNGFRGETSTDDKMKSRVEHDLYYIDNWSIWLDLRILALTVISSKARSNAY
ncbi:MAG: undecaprenyl-phosphate glucose phosphotransferase [Beijerinckiaceae bacterium]|nr:undecaprenyl-phosphate glucose phosphotransferase [Beijerinckiaceae bacterium]